MPTAATARTSCGAAGYPRRRDTGAGAGSDGPGVVGALSRRGVGREHRDIDPLHPRAVRREGLAVGAADADDGHRTPPPGPGRVAHPDCAVVAGMVVGRRHHVDPGSLHHPEHRRRAAEPVAGGRVLELLRRRRAPRRDSTLEVDHRDVGGAQRTRHRAERGARSARQLGQTRPRSARLRRRRASRSARARTVGRRRPVVGRPLAGVGAFVGLGLDRALRDLAGAEENRRDRATEGERRSPPVPAEHLEPRPVGLVAHYLLCPVTQNDVVERTEVACRRHLSRAPPSTTTQSIAWSMDQLERVGFTGAMTSTHDLTGESTFRVSASRR